MRIAVRADHAGVPLNKRIIEELRRSGHEVIDFGTHDSAALDDYPDYARMAGEGIQQRCAERGILDCDSGVGACVADVAKLEPGPGQVLVKIGGAGVCHSDLHVMEEDLGFSGTFTLGHENAGWVAELGDAVTGVKEGDAVAVYGPWGCGPCTACQLSLENYCENWAEIGGFGGGLGFDGGVHARPRRPAVGPARRLEAGSSGSAERRRSKPYHAI